jgi:hypothetical protein
MIAAGVRGRSFRRDAATVGSSASSFENRYHCTMDDELRFPFDLASKNWDDWRDVFEHNGPIATNPLFAEPGRFGSFLSEYSVYRTLRKGQHSNFRQELATSSAFSDAVVRGSGRELDLLEQQLRPRFGVSNPHDELSPSCPKLPPSQDRNALWHGTSMPGKG